MIRAYLGRSVATTAVLAALVVLMAGPAFAQATGMVKGKVIGPENKPVEDAKIIIEFKDGVRRVHDTKTNAKGEFIQIGLASGTYSVTAEKEGLGSQTFDVRIRIGNTSEVNFTLVPGIATPTKADIEKMNAVKGVFDEGVAASRANDFDAAIAKFNEALVIMPDCADCYYNLGYAYTQKKDYGKAEEMYKKALEHKADYVEAYNGLANIYNAQKKFDEAGKASAEAARLAGGSASGASADALFNQGIIYWNSSNVADARKQFEEAIKVDPNHAEAHYWLGMALVNEGKLAEAGPSFEEYLKLAPTGQYAAQAQGILSTIKK